MRNQSPLYDIKNQRTDIQVNGLKELTDALFFLSTKEKNRYMIYAIQNAGKKILVPQIKTSLAADIKKPGSHRGNPGNRNNRGPLAKNVSAKRAKTRSGELVAIAVGPNAWYRHFFIRGVKPHVISAKVPTGDRNVRGRFIRRVNAGTLKLPRGWRSVIYHPGHGGSDAVGRVAAGQTDKIVVLVQQGIFKEMERRRGRG